jgi:hypothetical protein
MASKVLKSEGRALTFRAKAAWSIARKASQLLTEHGQHLPARGRRVFQVFSPLARQIGTGSYPAVSGLSISRTQAPDRDDCIVHRCFAISLRQDAAPAVSARAHPISQVSQAIARCAQSGRGSAGDRFSGEPDAPRHGAQSRPARMPQKENPYFPYKFSTLQQ